MRVQTFPLASGRGSSSGVNYFKILAIFIIIATMVQTTAMAQTRYYIGTAVSDGAVVYKINSPDRNTLLTTVESFFATQSAIRNDANGNNCRITVGNYVGQNLTVSNHFSFVSTESRPWGEVTLDGGMLGSSTNTSVIEVSHKDTPLNIRASIINNNTSAESNAVAHRDIGIVNILASDNENTSAISSAGGIPIEITGGGTINIKGGTITAPTAASWAVRGSGTTAGSINLGGSPTITGKIGGKANLSVITTGTDAFNPGTKSYTLDFDSYELGRTAITNAKDFLANFKVASEDYNLAVAGNNLAITAKGYTKSGNVYTITQMPTLYKLQDVINAIRYDANGADISIFLGFDLGYDETTPLNITENIEFSNATAPAWGKLTLLGKAHATTGNLSFRNGIVAESKAIITINYGDGGFQNEGTLTISGGSVTGFINNTGTLNVSGGTIASKSNAAINGGNIFISGNAVISSAAPSNLTNGTISLPATGGKVEITGGTITNSAPNGNAIAGNLNGIVTLGGSPTITGSIVKIGSGDKLGIIASGENAFAPGEKIYAIQITIPYSEGDIAVANAKDFAENFQLTLNPAADLILAPSGDNLIIADPATVPIRLPQIASSQASVKANGNAILLENVPSNSKVAIYNLRGELIYSQFLFLNSQLIEVQTKGLYIIKLNQTFYRVTVK